MGESPCPGLGIFHLEHQPPAPLTRAFPRTQLAQLDRRLLLPFPSVACKGNSHRAQLLNLDSQTPSQNFALLSTVLFFLSIRYFCGCLESFGAISNFGHSSISRKDPCFSVMHNESPDVISGYTTSAATAASPIPGLSGVS
jgi:hypothetical protein